MRLDVRDGALRAPGEQCAGSVPFLYLHGTAPYRLEDGDGTTVATGRLPQGRAVPALREELGVPRVPTFCRMRFAVRAPERREYRLVVDERESLRFSASSDRSVELSVPAALTGGGSGASSDPQLRTDVTTARGGAAALPDELPAGVSYRRVEPTTPRAPAFALRLLDGHPVAGRELWRSRPVVLVFFSSWCGPCAEGQAAVDALARRYRDAVAFLGVAGQDERQAVAGYVERHEVSYAVAIDESLDVWRRYAVREPPAVVLIGPGGRLLRGWPGAIDAGRLERALERLVVGTVG